MILLSKFATPGSPVRLEQQQIKAVLDKHEIGIGTLFVSERTLCWTDDKVGFSLSYPHISLHAVSNDPNLYPQECIYVMLDTYVIVPGVNYKDANEYDEEVADFSELILVPEDGSKINAIYEALKECQALNPDSDDVSNEDDEDDIFEDADENQIVNAPPNAAHSYENANTLANELNYICSLNADIAESECNEDMFEDAD